MHEIIPVLALMIPMVAIVMGVGVAFLAIYLSYRRRKELFTMFHQERMAAIEKGLELPPLPDALLTEDGKALQPYNPRRHLLKGLAWSFVGIGAGAGLWETVGRDWALFSLVPIGIGVAQLIYYFVEGKKEAEALEREPISSTASV